MKITAIGTGNAFSHMNYNQCFLLEEDGRRMLFDYGYQIPTALYNSNIDVNSIDDVYISHAHADHCGGLESLAFMRYDWIKRPQHFSERDKPAPRLIANKQLLIDLWDKTLKGGLENMEGFPSELATFFEPVAIEPNKDFIWQGWHCQLIQQIHIMTGSMISNTFGLLMSKPGRKTVYFTADSQHCSPKQMEIFYKKADIIFQDCECLGVDTSKKEFIFGSGVHANYAQLAGYSSANSVKLSDDIKYKMYLSHYQDFVITGFDFLGNHCNWDKLAEDDGFKGFIKVGDFLGV